jgi:hypothetical protein
MREAAFAETLRAGSDVPVIGFEVMVAFAGCIVGARTKDDDVNHPVKTRRTARSTGGPPATDARRQNDTRCREGSAFRWPVMQFGTRQIKIGGLIKNLGGSFGKTSGRGRNTAVKWWQFVAIVCSIQRGSFCDCNA